jgi:hypothetical protein
MINHSDEEELGITDKIEQMIVPMSDEDFYTFFIDKTDIWEKASTYQKDFIREVYPAHTINHNEVSRALARGFAKKNRYTDESLKQTIGMARS